MQRRRILEIALAIVALLASGETASAQDVATRKAARILADEGLTLYDGGDYAGALEKLNKANALVSAPTVDLFAARCLARLGRLVEASVRYDEVLGAKIDESSPEAFKSAVNEARSELDALRPRVPSLDIKVEGGLDGVTVRVDGAEVPEDRLRDTVPVDPGKHAVEGQRGDQTAAEEVTVREGESAAVVLKLPVPEPPPSKPPVTIAPDDTGATQRTIGWIGLGIGAAAIGVWGVTGALALGQEGDLSDQGCSDGRCPHGVDPGGYDGLRTVSTIGFWAGIVGVGAGAALLLTAPRPVGTQAGGALVAPWASALGGRPDSPWPGAPRGGIAGVKGAF